MNNDNNMKQTVIGIYDTNDKARQAEKTLINEGFSKDRVDISASAPIGSEARDHESSVSSFFGNLFGNDDEARRHAEVAKRGTVVTVHTQSMKEAERAAAILDKFGTIDVDDYGRTGRTGAETATGKGAIPVIEEELEVGKREVTTGGVRLRSRIVERPIEEHLRLREEHVTLDRKPVDRKATETDLKNFKEGTIEAKERSEVPVVNKEARVVEEITLNKEVSTHDETIRDTVRKTDVDVDKIKSEERKKENRY